MNKNPTWVSDKTKLMEALLFVSAKLEADAERGFFDELDSLLRRRAELLKQMADVDQQLSPKDWMKTNSHQTNVWTRQLQEVQRRDEEVKKHIRKQQRDIQSELRSCAREKEFLFEEYSMDSKGTRLHKQA